jgi:hypothetical protein
MGLFHRLDNESQAAFIICHEIAHFYLQHSERSIGKYVERINSDEVQQELRRIKSSRYKKGEQLDKLVKGLSFNSFRHVRDNEGQADSMAVELMRNTRFNVFNAITTLRLLDSIDTDTLNTAACLERMFNSANYPFQKKWIAREEGLLSGHATLSTDALDDSLKTHPDCQLRIKKLQVFFNNLFNDSASNNNLTENVSFKRLKNIFRYEIIEYSFASENYPRSLQYSMELLQEHPSDPYLVTQVGKILNGFYNAQKEHRLNKVADLPSPQYPPNYNMLLQFIQNLYPENFASISFHYLNNFHPRLNYYQPFKNAYSTSIQIAKR